MKLNVAFTAALFLLAGGQAAAKPAYQTWKLKNGLDIIVLESKKVPLVTIALASKAGGMTETPETAGLTHLWEHMFFKGNKRIPSQEQYLKRIRQLGIQFNGSTSSENVNYYFTLPSVFLEEGIQFMADAIQTPLIDQKEMERERGVVLNEYQRAASNPAFNMRNLSRHLIYGTEEYRRDALGIEKNIVSATREQLLKIKDDVFVPANCALIIGGDLDTAQLTKLIDKYFAEWKNPDGWKFPKRPDFPPFPKTQLVTMTNPEVSTPTIRYTFNGPKARSQPEDSFAADILISLLDQSTGKFYKRFVDSGLTLHSGLSYTTQSQAGEVVLYASVKAEKVIEAEKKLLAETSEWAKDGYFTQSELDTVRRSLLVGHKRELNQPSEYVKGSLGFWWAIAGLDYYDSYLDNLGKISLKDVQSFVKKYLDGKDYLGMRLLSPTDAKKIGLKDNSDALVKKHLGAYYDSGAKG
jgi:zinc protease